MNKVPHTEVQFMNRQQAFCDTRNEQQNIPYAFEHLLRLNRFNNQVFSLSGFGHLFNNSINSIQLGSRLLNHYVQEITARFDELNNEPDRLPAGFQKECCSILAAMPQVIQGISDSAAATLKQFASYLPEITGQTSTTVGSTVDINLLVSLCSSMIRHQITDFTNLFRLDLKDTPVVLSGSAQQMSQVILNLLMNALLSLPDRSCEVVISTSCDHEAGQVMICIRDEGMGISKDIFPHIVKPFFTTWQERGCAGLGLTVADRIIRNHGGELSIDSEPGKGTTVCVLLPLSSPDKLECNHD